MSHATKYWAQIDGTKIVGVRKVKARKHVKQIGCVEISEDDFVHIRANPDLDFFFSDDTITARPKVVPYDQARREEYPDVADQIGALMKAAEGDDSELQTLLKTIKNVKQKYPKK